MNRRNLDIVILGLSITSSWGNGHAATYRALVRELAARGHPVLFLERDVPWYAQNRDMPHPTFCRTELYAGVNDLKNRFEAEVRGADLVIVGSCVPDGVDVAAWVTSIARGGTAFYDIDTPVTLAKLERGDEEYMCAQLIPRFDMYLSFTGGPTLDLLASRYGAREAKPLYCSFDPSIYYPEERGIVWDLGYLGTYSADSQIALDRLMLQAARKWSDGRFVVAGQQYPQGILWPDNVQRIQHLPSAEHRAFYCSQRFTLNVTRADIVHAGYSPSVRLFEAAACAVPAISDWWDGLDTFFEPGTEVLISKSADQTLAYLRDMSDEERVAVGHRARLKALACHTAAHRAEELERYALELLSADRAT